MPERRPFRMLTLAVVDRELSGGPSLLGGEHREEAVHLPVDLERAGALSRDRPSNRSSCRACERPEKREVMPLKTRRGERQLGDHGDLTSSQVARSAPSLEALEEGRDVSGVVLAVPVDGDDQRRRAQWGRCRLRAPRTCRSYVVASRPSPRQGLFTPASSRDQPEEKTHPKEPSSTTMTSQPRPRARSNTSSSSSSSAGSASRSLSAGITIEKSRGLRPCRATEPTRL